jgi:hypothetical protein
MEYKDYITQFENLSLEELEEKELEITAEMAKMNYNPELVNKLFAIQTLKDNKQ